MKHLDLYNYFLTSVGLSGSFGVRFFDRRNKNEYFKKALRNQHSQGFFVFLTRNKKEGLEFFGKFPNFFEKILDSESDWGYSINITKRKEISKVPKISIKAARVNAGLTQEKAARQLGISPDTLARYEKDSGKLSLEMLKKLSDLYKIPTDFLKLS